MVVVDMKMHETRLRVITTHGDPSNKMYKKLAHYQGVIDSLAQIEQEDNRNGDTLQRETIWMGDHNIVFRKLDEAKHTYINKK